MFFPKILDLIFPPVCGICGKPIKNNTTTCLNCASILQYGREKKVINPIHQDFDRLIALFPYEGIIREKLLSFKFHSQKYIKYSFARLLADRIQKEKIAFDIIIPVPISKKRYHERGFNQSNEIAKELSYLIHKRVEKRVLIKSKDNAKQSTLSKKKRQQNVKGVYEVVHTEKLKEKRVLLIDDIITTGATVNECAKTLKENGAIQVIVMTLAYA